MTADLTALVNSIPDRQSVSVTLTNTKGKKLQLACVFKESKAPSFFLLFPSRSLRDDIDIDKPCAVISQDQFGETVSLAAKIVDIPSNRVIELVANQSIRPEDLREYFRVNIRARVEVLYTPGEGDDDGEPLKTDGQTVDISQTGVLTLLSNECNVKNSVMIEINLPNPAGTVICSGRVIRSERVRKNRWLTAFHFENISPESRELIAKNCFAEQRRQLRENIQTTR